MDFYVAVSYRQRNRKKSRSVWQYYNDYYLQNNRLIS